ncbi:conserved protein, unknown function [Hepatocystis sp. ex Piliocolobus tephrosceles]|nr:conserved protein, unknown function [Hepatocystis sp. ex Piliocolobus tephrosceles]
MISSFLLKRKVVENICKNMFRMLGKRNLHDKTYIEQTNIYDNYEILKKFKNKNTLKYSLKKFREIVQKETQKKAYNFYKGWPPRDRIKITDDEKLGLYGRKLFIFNRVKGLKESEPNLCICCKNKGVLLFNRSEFEALLKNMNTIKHNLQEFAKKI